MRKPSRRWILRLLISTKSTAHPTWCMSFDLGWWPKCHGSHPANILVHVWVMNHQEILKYPQIDTMLGMVNIQKSIHVGDCIIIHQWCPLTSVLWGSVLLHCSGRIVWEIALRLSQEKHNETGFRSISLWITWITDDNGPIVSWIWDNACTWVWGNVVYPIHKPTNWRKFYQIYGGGLLSSFTNNIPLDHANMEVFPKS